MLRMIILSIVKIRMFTWLLVYSIKNAAKRTRQHAMKKILTLKFIRVSVNHKNGHTVAVVRAWPKLRLLSKVVFRQRSSTVKGRLLSKVVFGQRSSSVKGRLPSKVVFRQRSSSVKSLLPWKVVFHQMASSAKGCLPSKVVFHQR